MALATVFFCLVMAVGDGDSLSLRCPGEPPVRVRLATIDAPELRQAYGREAREHLRRLCLRQQARVHQLGRDKYGRLLANVRCRGEDAASAQLRAGLAWVWPPLAQQYPQLKALEQQARTERTGLWAQKRPLAPWSYRKRHGGRQ